MTKATILIDGMSCMHCAMRVKKAIESLPGISSLDVEVGKATVTYEESSLDQATIENAIVKAGYRIKA